MVWTGKTRERLNKEAEEKDQAYKKAISEIVYDELKDSKGMLQREAVERAIKIALNKVKK
jgi:hypothetical protein